MFSQIKNKILNFLKKRRCKLNRHISGAHKILEKVPTGEWEPPRNNNIWIRPITVKLICENCQNIFISETWDYKYSEPARESDS